MLEHPLHSFETMPSSGFCRTHELNILLLAALYAVSRVLSRSLAFNESLRDVLRILHDEAGLTCGMIGIVDPVSGNLTAHLLHHPSPVSNVQYEPGEGILGLMLFLAELFLAKRLFHGFTETCQTILEQVVGCPLLHHGDGLGAVVPSLRRACDRERCCPHYRYLDFFHRFVLR